MSHDCSRHLKDETRQGVRGCNHLTPLFTRRVDRIIRVGGDNL